MTVRKETVQANNNPSNLTVQRSYSGASLFEQDALVQFFRDAGDTSVGWFIRDGRDDSAMTFYDEYGPTVTWDLLE